MEWMPVNNILKEQITKLNYTWIPPGCQGDVRTLRMVQETLGKVIDSLGEQSAAAQGLAKVMTTAEKLRNAPTHTLYLLKDPAGKNGDGEVIGFLKVAYKHLYMFDEKSLVHQVEPLCVLDFYVSGVRQRNGNGKKLFDYMLQDTGSKPQKLAVDGPSAKMESFLTKNYGVNQLIRQSNSFAVFPAFFITADDVKNVINWRAHWELPGSCTIQIQVTEPTGKSGRTSPALPAPVGRYAARKPTSSIAGVIHGASEQKAIICRYDQRALIRKPRRRTVSAAEAAVAETGSAYRARYSEIPCFAQLGTPDDIVRRFIPLVTEIQ